MVFEEKEVSISGVSVNGVTKLVIEEKEFYHIRYFCYSCDREVIDLAEVMEHMRGRHNIQFETFLDLKKYFR